MERIVSVSINQEPLEDDKKYKMVIPSALIEGNDGKIILFFFYFLLVYFIKKVTLVLLMTKKLSIFISRMRDYHQQLSLEIGQPRVWF